MTWDEKDKYSKRTDSSAINSYLQRYTLKAKKIEDDDCAQIETARLVDIMESGLKLAYFEALF